LPGAALGGAIYNAGQLILDRNTFSSNSVRGGDGPAGGTGSAIGGALFDMGVTRATNDTFYANSAAVLPDSNGVAYGGAIGASNATIWLVNDTLATNSVKNGAGAGIWNTNSSVTVANTILANRGANCAGPLIDGGNNLSSDGSCHFTNSASLNNIDPQLDPFGYYFGFGGYPLDFFPLAPGSPAIDRGNDAVAPAIDERGNQRPYGKASDLGAIESSPPYVINGRFHSFWPLSIALVLNGNALEAASRGPYDIYGLLAGQYNLMPVMDNFLFTPSSQEVTVDGDVAGIDFNAYELKAGCFKNPRIYSIGRL
jgi:hypothetical protein